MFIGIVQYWDNMNELVRFILLGVILASLVACPFLIQKIVQPKRD